MALEGVVQFAPIIKLHARTHAGHSVMKGDLVDKTLMKELIRSNLSLILLRILLSI